MFKLKDMSTDDIREYIREGLLDDDDCDDYFWTSNTQEKHELILSSNKISPMTMVHGLYLTPHPISKSSAIYIVDKRIDEFYSVLERGRLFLVDIIPEGIKDPLRLRPEYFRSLIPYTEGYEHLLPCMEYIIDDRDDVEMAVELHKKGLKSVALNDLNDIICILRELHSHGIRPYMSDDDIPCMSISDMCYVLYMGYIPEQDGYIDHRTISPEELDRCYPYLSHECVLQCCLLLGKPLPNIRWNRFDILTLETLDDLVLYSKRLDMHELKIRVKYSGTDGDELLKDLNIIVSDIDLAIRVLDKYPFSPISLLEIYNIRDIKPPTTFYPNGAQLLYERSRGNHVVIKYMIDYYPNIFIVDNSPYFTDQVLV